MVFYFHRYRFLSDFWSGRLISRCPNHICNRKDFNFVLKNRALYLVSTCSIAIDRAVVWRQLSLSFFGNPHLCLHLPWPFSYNYNCNWLAFPPVLLILWHLFSVHFPLHLLKANSFSPVCLLLCLGLWSLLHRCSFSYHWIPLFDHV